MASKRWPGGLVGGLIGGLIGGLLSVVLLPTWPSQAARKRVVHHESEVTGTLLAIDATGALVPQPGLVAQLRCIGPDGPDRRFTVTCDSQIVVKRGEQVIAKGSRGLRGVEYRAVAGNGSSVELSLVDVGAGASLLVLQHSESEGDEEMRTTQHDQVLVIDGSTVREVYDFESEETWEPGPDANRELIPPSSLRSAQKLGPDGASSQGAPNLRLYSSSGPAPDHFSLSTILTWNGRVYAACGTCKATSIPRARKAPPAPAGPGKPAAVATPAAPPSAPGATPAAPGATTAAPGATTAAPGATTAAPPSPPPVEKGSAPTIASPPGGTATDALSLIDADSKASIEPLLARVLKGELLTAESLKALSQASLTRLRNAPFARHGRPFKSNSLQTFFYGARPKDQATPLLPLSPNPTYSDALLDDRDRANLALILAEVRSRTAPAAK